MNNQDKLEELKLTVVYDNDVFQEGLKSEWGFACLIEGPEKTILFDTGGDGAILMSNMQKLGIDPGIVDIVVLSHEHWDHVGGLSDFLEKNCEVSVYMLKSFPGKLKKTAKKRGADVIEVHDPVEICRNVRTTGEMGSQIKEHGLIISTVKGSIVITGCAHPGIAEIAEKAKEIGKDKILFVMGGFHLMGHKRSQIESIIGHFRKLGVQYASPCHCSGENARLLFAEEYKDHYIKIGAGRIITLENFD